MQITGGFLKSRKIESPKGENVRPTLSQIRESVFSTLFSMIDFEGSAFLDMFAGSGIMGFEALSRGFDGVSFVERDRKTYFLIKQNAVKLGVKAEFFLGDAFKILPKFGKKFDVIFVDPPYQCGLYNDILRMIRENSMLTTGGIVVLEHPSSLKIEFNGYELLKQKKHADKCLSYLK